MQSNNRVLDDLAKVANGAVSTLVGMKGEAEALVRQLTGQNQAGVVAFAAEAGLFQEAGVPSVICGPGSIDQAHRPDEYVEISQLKECEDFLRKLANWAAE